MNRLDYNGSVNYGSADFVERRVNKRKRDEPYFSKEEKYRDLRNYSILPNKKGRVEPQEKIFHSNRDCRQIRSNYPPKKTTYNYSRVEEKHDAPMGSHRREDYAPIKRFDRADNEPETYKRKANEFIRSQNSLEASLVRDLRRRENTISQLRDSSSELKRKISKYKLDSDSVDRKIDSIKLEYDKKFKRLKSERYTKTTQEEGKSIEKVSECVVSCLRENIEQEKTITKLRQEIKEKNEIITKLRQEIKEKNGKENKLIRFL